MRFIRTLALVFVVIVITGCLHDKIKVNAASDRPKLFYIINVEREDLRSFKELDDIVLKFYDYKIVRFSGVYDKFLAEGKFHKLKQNPRFKKSINYWKYLSIRNPPGKLSKKDIKFVKKYGVTQTPSLIVVYEDEEIVQFSKQMSDEMLNDLMQKRLQSKNNDGNVNDILKSFWRMEREKDRAELAKWLKNRVLR